MDSKLVVEQMSGRWQVKHPSMRPLAREAVSLRSRFDRVTFEWIPRAQNTRADRLANEAMDRAAGVLGRGVAARAAPAREAPLRPATWVPPDEAPTRLLLARHGATAHSAEKRFSGRNELLLDEVGAAQAAALAKRLAGIDAVAVVSSPLLRARQTADVIASALGVGVGVNDDLAEVDFGRWEGLTFAEAQRDQPHALAEWLASADTAPPDGESFSSAARRVRRGRDSILAAHPRDTVVVVTHVTPIKTLLRLALEAPPVSLFRIHLDTASVSTIDYFTDGNSSVRLMNDTSHLGPLIV
jgi:broad specificity phosphatase PhoE